MSSVERLTGKALIRATNAFAHEKRGLSWIYTLSTLLLLIITFAGTVLSPWTGLKIVSGIAAALVMCRMFVIYHDFQHKAILRNSLAARLIMKAFGLLALTPESIWKWSHNHHHDHNAKFSSLVAGSFPIMSSEAYMAASAGQRFKYRLLRHPLIILLAYLPVFIISFCLYPFFESPKKHYDCGIAALMHTGLICLTVYFLGWQGALFSIFIPFTLVSAIGAYIFYAQHNAPQIALTDHLEWDYVNAALNSSSYIQMNPFWSWVTANVGYHHVHHINARIPFYRLPETMKALPELQTPRVTSLKIGEIRKCLRLKLWDRESGRLISLKEFESGVIAKN